MLKAERISCSDPKLSDAQTRNFEAIKHSREVADRIFRRVDCEGQGLNAALAALGLERRHTRPRLERACEMALAPGRPSPRYRHLKPILETNQDGADGAHSDDGGPGEDGAGYVRGADLCGEEA